MNLGYIFYSGLASNWYKHALTFIKQGNYKCYNTCLDVAMEMEEKAARSLPDE